MWANIKFGIAAMPLFKNYTFRVTSSKTCNKSHCKSKLLTTTFSKVALFKKHAVECSETSPLIRINLNI